MRCSTEPHRCLAVNLDAMHRPWVSASLLSRYTAFLCCLLLTALSLWYLQGAPRAPWPMAMLALGCGLSLIGSFDLLQTRRAVLRLSLIHI